MTPCTEDLYDPLRDTPSPDLYDRYTMLREEHPVFYSTRRAAWCLARYDDVLSVARDWSRFSNAAGVDLDVDAEFFGPGDFLDADPPLHDELRNLVREWFTPTGVRRLEAVIEQRVTTLLDELRPGEVDLARDFAWRLPISVISSVLGIPNSDLDLVGSWLTRLMSRTPGAAEAPPDAHMARDALHEYLRALVQSRAVSPTDDLATALAQAMRDRSLASRELLGLVLLLFAAGSETTAGLLANGLALLDAHQDQQGRVRTGQTDITALIEEVLRYDSPIQYLCRTTTEPVAIRGRHIPQGKKVVLLYGCANRDGERFEDGDTFHVERERRRHLAFGNGLHFCLGANLARLEARIAFTQFFSRVREYSVIGAPTRLASSNVRAIVALPTEVSLA